MYNHMVVHSERSQEEVDLLFHALADATRRDIVTVVLEREHSVSELARRYPMSFAAVQKHVAVLARAGLVTKRRHGREQLVAGAIDTVRDVNSLLAEWEQLWRQRLDRISELLNETEGNRR
ncbi:MAG TPA: metalloregulator ArsR/SmtB family transcription factor [Acidimicrobiales bacterium]